MNPPKMSSQQADYTSGSIARNLWTLSWPMTLSMLLFTLPNALDGVWLGRLGSEALAAAGLAMSLRITMISPLMALSMAGGAVVARYVGTADTVSPMIISIIALWLVQLPLIYLLSRVIGLDTTGIWIALVISPLIQCAATTLRFRQGCWKLKKI